MQIILLILCWRFSPFLVRVIAPRFSGEVYDLTVSLTRISIISILFISMYSSYAAILQTLNDFTAPALIGVVLNIPIIIYIIVGANSIKGLMVATVIGNVSQLLIQIPWLIKHKYRYKFYINLKDQRVINLCKLILPIIVGAAVNQISAFVDKAIGSGLPEGSITALNFAQVINGLIYYVFGSAIVTVMYPAFSQQATEGNISKLKSYIGKSVININLVMIPATIGIIVLATPIVKLIFQRGAFDENSVNMTSIALTFYSLGVVFSGMMDIFNRAFYAIKDTMTPTISGIIAMITNIILNIILVRYMGIGGLALSTSITAFLCVLLLIVGFRKKVGNFNGKIIFLRLNKIFIASVIMGLTTKLSYNVLNGIIGGWLSLIISIINSIIVYSGMLMALKVPEFYDALRLVKREFSKKLK